MRSFHPRTRNRSPCQSTALFTTGTEPERCDVFASRLGIFFAPGLRVFHSSAGRHRLFWLRRRFVLYCNLHKLMIQSKKRTRLKLVRPKDCISASSPGWMQELPERCPGGWASCEAAADWDRVLPAKCGNMLCPALVLSYIGYTRQARHEGASKTPRPPRFPAQHSRPAKLPPLATYLPTFSLKPYLTCFL